jgi:hypothetical protein
VRSAGGGGVVQVLLVRGCVHEICCRLMLLLTQGPMRTVAVIVSLCLV